MDLTSAKDVFISAVKFATSLDTPCPSLENELKIAGKEQVEFLLSEDPNILSITSHSSVKSVVKSGICRIISSFETELQSLLSSAHLESEEAENNILQKISDLEWMCAVLPKIGLMKDFVTNWIEISGKTIRVVENPKLDSVMWVLKLKLIELTVKVLEAVGYGNVILPAIYRVKLIKTWLPYMRKMKTLCNMSEDLCESIDGAMVSLVLALPSNDQADIIGDWMRNSHFTFPDLTEAFEVWCYRTKSAKRRLLEGLDNDNDTSSNL